MEKTTNVAPMLFPYEPKMFREQLQQIISEEVSKLEKQRPDLSATLETPGLTYKPIFKMAEVCAISQVSKPTVYDWIKDGNIYPLCLGRQFRSSKFYNKGGTRLSFPNR